MNNLFSQDTWGRTKHKIRVSSALFCSKKASEILIPASPQNLEFRMTWFSLQSGRMDGWMAILHDSFAVALGALWGFSLFRGDFANLQECICTSIKHLHKKGCSQHMSGHTAALLFCSVLPRCMSGLTNRLPGEKSSLQCNKPPCIFQIQN